MPIGKKELTISIPAPNIQLMEVKIKGIRPLIFHKWSEKAKTMMRDKQAKKAQKGREIRNPEEEVKESFYYTKDGSFALPSLNLKQAIVDSSRNVADVTMTLLRGAIFVEGNAEGLIPIKEFSSQEAREDMVRVGMGSADLRYRGQLNDWKMSFTIKYNADVISPEQVLNLVQLAGFSCGLGEWRPQCKGDYGMFELDMA